MLCLYSLHLMIVLNLIGNIYVYSSSCSSVKDCITCVSKNSWVPLIGRKCNWCQLTKSCHAYKSPFNTCPAREITKRTADCYEKNYGTYSSANSYINLLLSAVAYSDHPKKCLKQLLPEEGFKIVAAIGHKCSRFLFKYHECFATVAVSDDRKTIVIANRGTSSTSQLIKEVLSVLKNPKQKFKLRGNVQKYFYDAFNLLYPCVSETVKDLLKSKPDYNVVITGHSLGGAIASLTAVALVYDNIISENKMELYTFGMPRVGDKTYASQHDRLVNNSWRVIHYNDYVTRLPTQTNLIPDNQPYHHQTEIYYPKVEMPPNATYKICKINEDPSCVESNSKLKFKIKYHTNYFNLPVGQQCSNIGARRKRSANGTEISAMAHMFTNNTCKVIKFDDYVSGQAIIKLNVALVYACIMILCVHAYQSFY